MREELRKWIELTVKLFVDVPDKVKVEMVQGEQTTLYKVSCGKEDLGKVIGKQGGMARSLRAVILSVATKNSFRAVMDIVE